MTFDLVNVNIQDMDTTEQLRQIDCSVAASTLPQNGTNSPKTPVRTPLDDSLEDYQSDEIESPSFPHLIPVNNRRKWYDNDWEGVRIGWDDGYGSVFYQDDDYGAERNGRRFKRSRSGRLFTDRCHQSVFGSPNITKSPSHAVIQAELNDYLGCILNCLSAKKRNRQLQKSKSESNPPNDLKENSTNISNLLNDSTDDEMLILCSQAIEKTIFLDANTTKSNSLSIDGISPLKDISSTLNNNLYYHSTKKFKPATQCKPIDEKEKTKKCLTQCHTVTSEIEDKPQNETKKCLLSTSNNDKETFSSLLDDSLANDDELFSALDLSAIEQQVKESAMVTTQKNDTICAKQQNSTFLNSINNRNNLKPSTSSNSLLWRRTLSSSIVISKQQNNEPISSVNEAINNSNTYVNNGIKRYCTPAEIEEKRNQAQRTQMLKFKSRNKSAF